MPRALRLAMAPLLVALGAVNGLAAVAVHARLWGLVWGLAATVAVLVALPRGWWSRLAFALGWAALVGYAATTRPEGDYVIAADGSGYALLVVAPVLVVAALVTLPPPRRVRDVPEREPPDP
jgi:hypothetical protein